VQTCGIASSPRRDLSNHPIHLLGAEAKVCTFLFFILVEIELLC
jgi:hypothetical protein